MIDGIGSLFKPSRSVARLLSSPISTLVIEDSFNPSKSVARLRSSPISIPVIFVSDKPSKSVAHERSFVERIETSDNTKFIDVSIGEVIDS